MGFSGTGGITIFFSTTGLGGSFFLTLFCGFDLDTGVCSGPQAGGQAERAKHALGLINSFFEF